MKKKFEITLYEVGVGSYQSGYEPTYDMTGATVRAECGGDRWNRTVTIGVYTLKISDLAELIQACTIERKIR